MSALHQFAQMQRVQLELKETVATGKYSCRVGCNKMFFLEFVLCGSTEMHVLL